MSFCTFKEITPWICMVAWWNRSWCNSSWPVFVGSAEIGKADIAINVSGRDLNHEIHPQYELRRLHIIIAWISMGILKVGHSYDGFIEMKGRNVVGARDPLSFHLWFKLSPPPLGPRISYWVAKDKRTMIATLGAIYLELQETLIANMFYQNILFGLTKFLLFKVASFHRAS